MAARPRDACHGALLSRVYPGRCRCIPLRVNPCRQVAHARRDVAPGRGIGSVPMETAYPRRGPRSPNLYAIERPSSAWMLHWQKVAAASTSTPAFGVSHLASTPREDIHV
jgi:hypothetical protein